MKLKPCIKLVQRDPSSFSFNLLGFAFIISDEKEAILFLYKEDGGIIRRKKQKEERVTVAIQHGKTSLSCKRQKGFKQSI